MDEKELVKEFMQNNEYDDMLIENDYFVELMLPLAECTTILNSGETPSKDVMDRARNTIGAIKQILEELDQVLEMMTSNSSEDEEA